jgi:hypothetical protein
MIRIDLLIATYLTLKIVYKNTVQMLEEHMAAISVSWSRPGRGFGAATMSGDIPQ